MILAQTQHHIKEAGADCTVVHNAQTSGWFEEWSRKCRNADSAVVIFSQAYRDNFTTALQKEAALILELYKAGDLILFILDPEQHSPSEVRANIQDGAGGMGDINAWIQYVTCAIGANGEGNP